MYRIKDLSGSAGMIQAAVGGCSAFTHHYYKLSSSTHDRPEHATANKVQTSVFSHLHRTWTDAADLRAANSSGSFGEGAALSDK